MNSSIIYPYYHTLAKKVPLQEWVTTMLSRTANFR